MRDGSRPRWVELRTAEGKLACKYDPRRHLIEYVHRRKTTIFDLTQYEETKSTDADPCQET